MERPICPKCGLRPVERANYRASMWRPVCEKCRRQSHTDNSRQRSHRRLKQEVARTTGCVMCGFIPVHLCQLDVDHKNGDYRDNSPDNVQVLCANCHRLKTLLNGDWQSKNSR